MCFCLCFACFTTAACFECEEAKEDYEVSGIIGYSLSSLAEVGGELVINILSGFLEMA